MSIHENIRDQRKRRKLTQEALAEAMGVSCAAVSKWENGQSAPDIGTLAALADFFEISVDALLNHQVKADRLKDLLAEMNAAADAHETEKAVALCDKLLRNYPNDRKVVEACANMYDQLHAYTQRDVYLEPCIAQIKRLFVLNEGEGDVERLNRLNALANKYSDLKQWKKAQEYYEQSNVGGRNDGSIARCLYKQGQKKEALTKVSEAIVADIFHQWQKISVLSEIWEDLGEIEKACDALKWILDSMESIIYSPEVMQILLVQIASLQVKLSEADTAKATIRKAEGLGELFDDSRGIQSGASFLQLSKPQALRTSANCRNIVADFAASLEKKE